MSDKKSKKQSLTMAAEYLMKIKPTKLITDKELLQHADDKSLWVAVHGRVFDLTDFYMEHPGGFDIIEEVAGQDATTKFEEGDHRIESIRDLSKYYIGEYEGKKLSLHEKK
jgi:cytochrome b involved in lipid metabolism